MTRPFLKSLLPSDLEGLDKIVDTIMDTHGVGIEAEKEKTAAANEKAKAQTEAAKALLEKTKKDYEDRLAAKGDETKAEAELNALKEEYEAAKVTHAEELKAATDAHDATKTEYETERTNSAMDDAVKAALEEAGCSVDIIPFILKAGYDRTQLTKEENGSFTGIDKLVEAMKSDPANAKIFGEKVEVGANVGNPRATGSPPLPKVLTKEIVASMSEKEINDNWDAVQAAMKT